MLKNLTLLDSVTLSGDAIFHTENASPTGSNMVVDALNCDFTSGGNSNTRLFQAEVSLKLYLDNCRAINATFAAGFLGVLDVTNGDDLELHLRNHSIVDRIGFSAATGGQMKIFLDGTCMMTGGSSDVPTGSELHGDQLFYSEYFQDLDASVTLEACIENVIEGIEVFKIGPGSFPVTSAIGVNSALHIQGSGRTVTTVVASTSTPFSFNTEAGSGMSTSR